MKSNIKEFIEKETVRIINEEKEKFPNIAGANLAGEKIIIPLKEELNDEEQDELSRNLSNIILIGLDKLRKEEKIANLPILTFNTNQKMISIEI